MFLLVKVLFQKHVPSGWVSTEHNNVLLFLAHYTLSSYLCNVMIVCHVRMKGEMELVNFVCVIFFQSSNQIYKLSLAHTNIRNSKKLVYSK